MRRSTQNGGGSTQNGGGGAVAPAEPVAALDRRQLLNALQRVRSGDFSVQLPGELTGLDGKIADAFDHSKGAWGEMETSVNTLMDDLLRPTTEVTGAIAAVARGDLTQTMRLDVD